MDFKFNEEGMRRVAEEAVANMAAQQTQDLERLRQQYVGQPIAVIRPALRQLFASYDGNITEPDLSEWAQLISDGTRIEMTPEPIDWSR
ncbi:hypothetical protein [Microbacterium sp. nov. GSS16]|uniref:hypothetical protein n=1 Tax=Microbacterium sp. nov. GSS16 TaxID=3019890 RepID=UPI0023066E07|nr:hypothetical protein [Microbacterium sp. nov. GSS16]WCD91449.1 hypothetical protein PGB26_06965 [Microbacterium sp. nov. GSS16]